MARVPIDPTIREKLWQVVSSDFERALTVIVVRHKDVPVTQAERLDLLKKVVKLAYQSGLDRGYDVGHAVFISDDD